MEWKADAWTTVLGVRNELFFETLDRKKAIDAANKYLFPVLLILEEQGIGVEYVTWQTWWKRIALKHGVKLNEVAYNRICELSGKPPEREVESGYIRFTFTFPEFYLKIDNGNGSCAVIKTVTQRIRPSEIVEDVTYEADCTGVDPV